MKTNVSTRNLKMNIRTASIELQINFCKSEGQLRLKHYKQMDDNCIYQPIGNLLNRPKIKEEQSKPNNQKTIAIHLLIHISDW